MSPLTTPPSARLPILSSQDLQALVEHTYDLVIALDDAGKVLSVSQDIDLSPMSLYNWIGTPFSEVLTVESLVKLPLLTEDAFTANSGSTRWRHINLRMGQQVLPILAKYTEFTDQSGVISRLIFGRDLRPLQRLQSQLVASHDKVVKNYEELIQAVSEKSQALDQRSSELIPYDQISQQARSMTLDQALGPFVQQVRTEVITRKLRQTQQNVAQSAQELGLSVAEVQTIADEVAST
jgi:transcriptional regulator with PAS, ATPase and Fis domain